MSATEKFRLRAAKSFLQSVVFVDDEIYSADTLQPGAQIPNLPNIPSPFRASDPSKPVETTPNVPLTADSPEDQPKYHPKKLVESFARLGMVCALYEPEPKFNVDGKSDLFKLCDRSDIVILDWDLYKEDGRNILPLILNLASAAQSSVPHHVRLCVIYTTKPDLQRVTGQIFDYLKGKGAGEPTVKDETSLVAGATTIVVYGKPNVPGRSEASKKMEVKEEDLAERVVAEFARMNTGLLPSYALHGMASIRRNTKRLIDKFSANLDSAFLLNRALVFNSEEAFNQLPELLADELLAVIQDSHIGDTECAALGKEISENVPIDGKVLENWIGQHNSESGVRSARAFLSGGSDAIEAKITAARLQTLSRALGCLASNSDKKLAALFAVRTRYSIEKPIMMGFGSIVEISEDNSPNRYALCLMPICDGIRLECGDGKYTAFPFWKLQIVEQKPQKGNGLVIENPAGTFVQLVATGKPRDMMFMESFQASTCGTVETSENAGFVSKSGLKMKVVAQLKPAHAQRIAHSVGQALSRVGVTEAEWLRLQGESGD
jgi:hypothetical protein